MNKIDEIIKHVIEIKVEKPRSKIFKGKFNEADGFKFFHVIDNNIYQFTFEIIGDDLLTFLENEYYLKDIPFERQGNLLIIKNYKKYINLISDKNIQEMKINKPFDPKKIIKLFNEDPVYFSAIEDHDSFDELLNDGFEWDNEEDKRKEFSIIKSLYDNETIECFYVGDSYKMKTYKISEYKNAYLVTDDNDDTYFLFTKF